MSERKAPVTFETILTALSKAKVRFVVAGGVAVAMYGSARFTADLDIFVDFSPGNFKKFIQVVRRLGYRARIPVSLEVMEKKDERARWRQEKGALVISYVPTKGLAPEIDVFTDEVQTRKMSAHAVRMKLGPVQVEFVSLKDLIAMKKVAGRAIDREDIRTLSMIQRRNKRGSV